MATMDIDQEIEERLATLDKHVLMRVSKTPEATVYRMGEPGTRNMSVVLVFVREPENRVILTGDIILGDGNGLVSDLGYTEGWFASPLGSHYLAEKFLRKTYVQEHAVAWIEDDIQETKSLLDDAKTDGDEAELKRLEKRLEELEDGLRRKETVTQDARAFGEFFESVTGEGPCEGEGCGYESGVYAWLSAVQQRFAKLRAELRAREEEEASAPIPPFQKWAVPLGQWERIDDAIDFGIACVEKIDGDDGVSNRIVVHIRVDAARKSTVEKDLRDHDADARKLKANMSIDLDAFFKRRKRLAANGNESLHSIVHLLENRVPIDLARFERAQRALDARISLPATAASPSHNTEPSKDDP